MTAPAASAPRRFAALRVADCRTYLIGGALAMMADNIEHVITYWVLWQRYHSPVLAGFEVFSHWLPFLLLSIPFGALADRFDCRRVIQAGQLLFAAVSIAWGVLFATNTLTVQAACVLLVLHGTAGALWGPAEQLMLHDFVGPDELPSAVRLNSTFRSLGILFGPVVGGLLLVGLGAEAGIFVNALFYAPLILFLLRTRATGHSRDVAGDGVRFGFRELGRIARFVAGDRTLVSMMALAGLGSFFVGASLQAVMPAFAGRLGAGEGDAAYSMLLFATGAGGVLGGLLLEATGWPRPTIRAAVVSTLIYGVGILGFAMTASFPLALVLLFLAGRREPRLDVDLADRRAADRPTGGARAGARVLRRRRERPPARQRCHGGPLRRGRRRRRGAHLELGGALRRHGDHRCGRGARVPIRHPAGRADR